MTAMSEISTTTARRAYDATLVSLVAAACLYGLATAVLEPAVAVALRVIGATGLATVAGLALAGVVLVTSSRLGPMWVTAPERLWRAPQSLLQERSRTVRLGSATVALLIGVVTAAAMPGAVPARAAWGLGAAVVVVLASAAAAAGQRLDHSSTVGAGGIILGIASVSVALVCTASGWLPLLVVAGGTIVALLARTGSSTRARPAPRWRPVPPLWELRRSGAVVDAQLAPRRRRLAVPACVRPLVRMLTTSRVIDLVPLLAVPAAVVPVGGRQAGVLSVFVLTYVFSLAVTQLLDVWVDSPALARTFARQPTAARTRRRRDGPCTHRLVCARWMQVGRFRDDLGRRRHGGRLGAPTVGTPTRCPGRRPGGDPDGRHPAGSRTPSRSGH
jgi:hypothetical protein